MFTKIVLSYTALKADIRKLFGSAKTHIIMAVSVLAMLTLGAQPAQAATTQPAEVPNILCYIGAPSLSWANGVKDQISLVTGAVLGAIILAGAIFIIIAGGRMVIAGKSVAKSGDGIVQAKNVIGGIAVIFGGLVVLVVVVGFFVGLANLGSC